jgi:hypothetical protein
MRCRWSTLALVLVLVCLRDAGAQPPIEPKDGKTIIPLTVDSVGPARPALKYRLLPNLRDTQTGNQIPAFYKCFLEQNNLFHNKESTDKQKKWMEAPLKDLVNEAELKGYGGSAYKQAQYAARLDTVNWELTNQAKSDGIGLLLPDVQPMRALAVVLKVRVRGEIARGEFDNAVQTLQTMFALARTFNEHPTLIGGLVGMALAMVALSEVEEFVQQPGAPNLFWPLVDLPAPFIDLRKGREIERLWLIPEFALLQKAVPAPEPDLQKLIKMMDSLLDPRDKTEMVASEYYSKQSKDKDALAAATARLKALGHKADDLAKLSPLQLVMTDDFAQYQAELDDHVKWINVPYWKLPADFGKRVHKGPLGAALPAIHKVMISKTRLQQHVALLTIAEGVRAHAAENGGKLPEKLDDVKLPLPADPVSGKPFVYERKDGKCVIRGTPPPGREKDVNFNRVYEVTIRK